MSVSNPVLQPVLRRVRGDVDDPFAGGYQAFASVYDGTNDFQLRGAALTGATDEATGIFSALMRTDGGDGVTQNLLTDTDGKIAIRKTSTNRFQFELRNAASTVVLNMFTSTTILAGTNFRHFLASWDLGAASAHLVVDGVSDVTIATLLDDTIDFTSTNWAIGAAVNGSFKLNATLAEYLVAPGQFLDFSVEANRERYMSASTNLIYLGVGGEQPTGVQPIIYAPDGDASVNRGSGGNFTTTGTLDLEPIP